MSKAFQQLERETSTRAPNVIKTPGLFSMMELPAELRIKILRHLLVLPHENITIDSAKNGACIRSDNREFGRPYVAILQTCKQINMEGTPLLYGHHTFTIYLPLDVKHDTRDSSFFLGPMRWSTISYINTMYFMSSTPSRPRACFMSNTPSLSNSDNSDIFVLPRAYFTCTAAHLLSRYTVADFKYSPIGPDEYVVLSMNNYVSTQVMRAELSAFQRELDIMMRPGEEYLAALADDPAT